jgi:predicted nucleic acid-binding protein
MAFVLDASIVACWAFDDENHETARAALERTRAETALVPGLWWYEVRNLLIVNERRSRISRERVGAFLRELSRLPIELDHAPVEASLIDIARRHELSAYDAAYLELASRIGAHLATLDRKLAQAALRDGITPL